MTWRPTLCSTLVGRAAELGVLSITSQLSQFLPQQSAVPRLPSVTSGRSPDQSQAAQWMGAWRDDSFLFRQVSPQLGEHVNKFKINSEPLLADTDTAPCVARRDTRARPQSCGTSWLSRLLDLVRNIGWGAGKSWKFWQSGGGVLTADRAANLKPQWGKTIGLK